MNKHEPLRSCPHCGSKMRAGSLTRHEPICVRNPAAAARYRAVLAAAPDSDYGITCGRYVELSTADKTLPTVITIRRLVGVSRWDDVLAAFGLQPPPAEQRAVFCPHCGKFTAAAKLAAHVQECQQQQAARQAAKPKPEPKPRKVYTFQPETIRKRTKPAMQICPHCQMQRRNLGRHTCPESPDVLAWLAANLPDPDYPGCIITVAKYKALPYRAISLTTLEAAYDSWGELAERFGLKLRTGAPVPGSKLDAASIAELHRLAQELHGGAFGPSLSEYQMHAVNGTYKAAGLAKMYGQRWGDVLRAAGLRVGTRSEYCAAAFARRKAHEAARPGVAQRVASRYERNDEPVSRETVGLPVLDKPRQLPGGGTAWMIR